ncbi:MAG: 3-hydroxyacyl-CoA dehydrogenase NAD-binding domain-containing protein [Acidobacteriota bacterium]|nr:MAG: 3-hydroxyacyl-CoA dehydrogenase NAD-binding domain-containing protein [Acidobacteriota bacterium]
MTGSVTVTRSSPIRVLSIDNPPVNGLGAAVRRALAEELAQALADADVDAIVIAGQGRMFCAGADIREFGQEPPPDTPELLDVIDAVEASTKPVVAAIHGVAAGGGLELALGCHARVASSDARVGLPEVTLGIIPGAGGTQRLPRLIGVKAALELIVSGKLIPAPKAKELGFIDELVNPSSDVVDAAVTHAKTITTPRRSSEGELGTDEAVFDAVKKSIAKKARGFEAPYAAIEAVRAATELETREGFAKEREIFLGLLSSDQARAQRHVFFAEREVAKVPDVPKDTKTADIQRVGIVGCGTMGGGIAMSFADAGLPVIVLESEEAALDRGLEKIRGLYESSVKKGRLSKKDMDARLARLQGTLEASELSDADIVVEAAFESMEVKKDVFRRLDEICKDDAILATNTSTLDVNEIADATKRPENVIGTHFFSPAHIMKLMENVRGDKTSKETVATVMKLSKRLGKVGVLVGVCDGFVGNRMLYAYRRQADFLLEEGALPQQVDSALYEFGLPMGPFAMADLAGLDIGWAIRKRQASTRPKDLRYSPIADRICEMDRFGQKTSAGWYRYEPGSRTPIPDPDIEKLVIDVSTELGFERRTIDDAEIVNRCMYPLINEGAKILEEGIALRPSDIDIVWIYGYGFPRYRGGPMFYADTVGVDKVYEFMAKLYEEQGEWVKPAPLLEKLAKQGKSFKEYADSNRA